MAANLLVNELALERRSKARYPVVLNVRYRTIANGPALAGVGRTLNVSSRGLLIACEEPLVEDGSRLQVALEWPSMLNGITPLQLIAVCRVTRCQSEVFAVQLERYQFRTRKS
jgi:hypothetical protein